MDALTRDRTFPVAAMPQAGPGWDPRPGDAAPDHRLRALSLLAETVDRRPSRRQQAGWPPTLLRVGVLDRDPKLAARLADAINDEGGLLAVGVACGAEPALALAASGVEIMLVDCALEGDSTPALVRAMKAERPSLTVVGLSNRLDRPGRAALVAAGAAGAIDRSTEPEDVAMIVREAFARPASAA